MKKGKRTVSFQVLENRVKPSKWQIICLNCYREQYCQFVLTIDCCIMFRPKEDRPKEENWKNDGDKVGWNSGEEPI